MKRADGKTKAVYAWVVITDGGVRVEAHITPSGAALAVARLTKHTGRPHHAVVVTNGVTKRTRSIMTAAKRLVRQIETAYQDTGRGKLPARELNKGDGHDA